MAGRPVAAAAWRALASAFSTKVRCGSSASPTPSSLWRTSATPSGANSCCSSASLPALLEARTSFIVCNAALVSKACCLQRDQLADALFGQAQQRVHLGAREGRAFGRALHFDEVAGAGHHHVHVGVAGRVFGVFEVEQRRAADDADRDRGHVARDRRGRRSCPRPAAC